MKDLIRQKQVTASQIPVISFAARGCLLFDQPSFEQWLEAYLKTTLTGALEGQLEGLSAKKLIIRHLVEINKYAKESLNLKFGDFPLLQRVLSEFFQGDELSHQAQKASELFHSSVKLNIPEYVFETLEQLKERGYRLAIISNESPALIEVMKVYRLFDFFDCVLMGQEMGALKPQPEIFTALTEEFEVSPHQVFHLGGKYAADVIGAQRAGFHAGLYDPQNFEVMALNQLEARPGLKEKVVELAELRDLQSLKQVKLFQKHQEILEFLK